MRPSNGSGSNNSLLNDPPRNKEEALVHQLNLLAEAFAEPLTADRLKVYVMALSELSTAQLSHGLNRAVRELTFWPRPAELYELCTGIKARKSETVPAAEAWEWMMKYLEIHGVEGETRYELQGRQDFVFRNGEVDSTQAYWCLSVEPGDVFATTAPFYVLTTYTAPEIPALIAATLTQLAGSVEGGLHRIAKAVKGAGSKGGGDPKEISFVRREFTEGYLNAVALGAERNSANIVPPSHQLRGSAATSFEGTRIPIRLFFQPNTRYQLGYEILSVEQASQQFDLGTLDAELLEAVKAHCKDKESRLNAYDTPTDYWAWFVPERGQGRVRTNRLWAEKGTGVFRIEAFDGSRVVHMQKVLRLDGREVKDGERIHIRVSPRCLEKEPSLGEIEVKE